MWWWCSRDDDDGDNDDDDSWGWIFRMGGIHRKRQKPKSQSDHTPKKTNRNPNKKTKKKERKKEIHQSSEWVCRSFHTKLISMSATSKFFGRKLFRTSTIWLNMKLSSAQNYFYTLTTLRTNVHPYCCSNSAWFKHSEFWSKLNYLLCQDFLTIRPCLRTHCANSVLDESVYFTGIARLQVQRVNLLVLYHRSCGKDPATLLYFSLYLRSSEGRRSSCGLCKRFPQ